MKDKDVILAGDGRCESLGKSVKFCTYSMMEIYSGVILHAETVDKREVGLQSPNMEKEAFTRSLNFLLPRIKCTEIITDASTSICTEIGLLKVCFLCAYWKFLLVATNHPTHVMCGIKPRNLRKLWQSLG